MCRRRVLLRTTWIVGGLALLVAWGFMAVGTGLTFLFAYGSPLGSYTGQQDERQSAWSFLIVLTVLSVILAVTVVWPLSRWRGLRAVAFRTGSPLGSNRTNNPRADATE